MCVTSAGPSALLPMSTRGSFGEVLFSAANHSGSRSNVVLRVRSKTSTAPAAIVAMRGATSTWRGAPASSHAWIR